MEKKILISLSGKATVKNIKKYGLIKASELGI